MLKIKAIWSGIVLANSLYLLFYLFMSFLVEHIKVDTSIKIPIVIVLIDIIIKSFKLIQTKKI